MASADGGVSDPVPWRPPPLDSPEDGTGRSTAASRFCEAEAAGREASRLSDEARKQAEEILAQARSAAEQIHLQARAEAIAKAGQRLEEALEETITEQVSAFEHARDDLLTQVRQRAEAQIAQIEVDLTGLIATMAAKVVRRKIEEEDGLVREVVRDTIAEAAGAKQFTVRICAADEEMVRAAQAELLRAADGAEELVIVADDSIEEGGCIVETERGRFDARISTQLELLGAEHRLLAETLTQPAPGPGLPDGSKSMPEARETT